MYTLEKIRVEPGHYSAVKDGYKVQGRYLSVFLAGEHDPVQLEGIKDIKIDWQVLLTGGCYLQTSPVQEILGSGPDWIEFKTMTSVYELRSTPS